jgi:C4-dicarboxylate transporter, DctQ subunit
MAFLETLSIRLGRWLAWGFLVIALMMVFEVVARYGFNRPTYWAHEIATLLAAVAFVFGGAFCMAEGSHMRIDLLLQGDRPRLRRLSDSGSRRTVPGTRNARAARGTPPCPA